MEQGYTYDDIVALVEKYAPRVVFHPNEPFFACSAEWFLPQTCLQKMGGDDSTPSKDCPSQTDLGRVCPSTDVPGNTLSTLSKCSYIDIPAANMTVVAPGNLFGKNGTVAARCYVHVLGYADKDYIDLQYLFFEAFNGGAYARFEATWFGWDSLVYAGPKGSHQGDWEHITVRITKLGKFIGAFYAQHSHGLWLSSSDISFVPGTEHPVVYVAWSTHASYGSVGTFTLLKKDKTGVLLDPSVSACGVTIGGADVTGNGTIWDTWKKAAIEIVKIDGLTMTGNVPASPDWVSFKGMWGGPYVVDYGIWETTKILAGFIIAAAKANSLLAAAVLAVIIAAILAAGVAAVITALIAMFGLGFFIGLIVLWKTEFKNDTSMGPGAPIAKGYWSNGETVTFNTGVTTLKSGKDYVNIKFSPGRTIFVSTHYALYSDRKNNLWYQTSTDAINWASQKQVPKTGIHCSPEPVVYEHQGLKLLYVFSQDSNAVIQYNLFDGSNWSRHSLTDKMILNANLSATIRDQKLYLVFRNTDKTLHMKAGAIDDNGGVTWTDVTVPSSIGALDTDPCITTFKDSLYVTYKQANSSYLVQCYGVLSAVDDRPAGELEWGCPNVFSSTVLPTINTPQPVVVNDRLFLLFANSTSNAAYNIYATEVSDGSVKYTYTLGPAFWLGMALKTNNKMGSASGPDAPLYLAVRQSTDDQHLYLSAAYI